MNDTVQSSIAATLARIEAENNAVMKNFADKISAQWDCTECDEKDNDGPACAGCGYERIPTP